MSAHRTTLGYCGRCGDAEISVVKGIPREEVKVSVWCPLDVRSFLDCITSYETRNLPATLANITFLPGTA